MKVLRERCVVGITANTEQCREHLENSIGLATALVPYIGYEEAARLAKEALKKGRKILELALESNLLDEGKIKEILDPETMTHPRSVLRRSTRIVKG